MSKKEISDLIDEFTETHRKHSHECGGYWKQTMPEHMDIKDGYWYWRGYRVSGLYDQLKKLKKHA